MSEETTQPPGVRSLPNPGELLASQMRNLITGNVAAAKKRREANNQIRDAVLKGYQDGDWTQLSALIERLAKRDTGAEVPTP